MGVATGGALLLQVTLKPFKPLQVPRIHVLRRSPEGAPVQVYVPENGEIITQV